MLWLAWSLSWVTWPDDCKLTAAALAASPLSHFVLYCALSISQHMHGVSNEQCQPFTLPSPLSSQRHHHRQTAQCYSWTLSLSNVPSHIPVHQCGTHYTVPEDVWAVANCTGGRLSCGQLYLTTSEPWPMVPEDVRAVANGTRGRPSCGQLYWRTSEPWPTVPEDVRATLG